jgi:hypothetical protein
VAYYTKPNFFVIGAARSGTTLLAESLRAHSEIFVTRPKEPHFLAFANGLPPMEGPGDDLMVRRSAVTDYADYLALFMEANDAPLRGDASVSTLYYPESSIKTLKQHFPGARLLVVLRDPVERAYSAYSYLRARGYEPCADFMDAVAHELNGDRARWHHLLHYVSMGMYARQLRPFLSEFDPSLMRILFYEDLRNDPTQFVTEALRFLDASPNRSAAPERLNVSGRPRSAALQGFVGWAGRNDATRRLVRRVVPFELRERIRRFNLRPEAVPATAADAILPLFKSDCAELAALLTTTYPDITPRLPSWLRTSAGGPS